MARETLLESELFATRRRVYRERSRRQPGPSTCLGRNPFSSTRSRDVSGDAVKLLRVSSGATVTRVRRERRRNRWRTAPDRRRDEPRDPERTVKTGRFREICIFRLNVIKLRGAGLPLRGGAG
jgi:hypothetical protein